MNDNPPMFERDPQYVTNVLEPLARGEGVACFLARDTTATEPPDLLFFTHTLSGNASRYAHDERDLVRAAQAIAVQRVARDKARAEGYRPTVK